MMERMSTRKISSMKTEMVDILTELECLVDEAKKMDAHQISCEGPLLDAKELIATGRATIKNT